MRYVTFLLFAFLLLPLRPWSQSITLETFFSPDQPLDFKEIPFSEYTGIRVVEETFAFSAGLRGDYAVSERLELGASFSYSQRSFQGQFYCYVCDFIEPPPVEARRLAYLEAALLATYRPLADRFSPRLTAGPSLAFPVEELELLAPGPIPGLQAAAGISYALSDRWRLSVDAVYRSTLGRTFPYYQPELETINNAGRRQLQSIQYRLGFGWKI